MLDFEEENENTLDDSAPIIVRSIKKDSEEYVFQFAVNKKEALNLLKCVKRILKRFKGEGK